MYIGAVVIAVIAFMYGLLMINSVDMLLRGYAREDTYLFRKGISILVCTAIGIVTLFAAAMV